MIISNLKFVEIVVDEKANKLQGGIAFSGANANAYASGRYLADTYTSTYANAYSGYCYSNASSGSSSSAVAI
jgi:hypothetical protein